MDESTIRLRWEAIETKSAAVMLSSCVMVSSVWSVVEPEVGDQDLIAMSEVFGLEQLTNFTDTQRDTVKEATEEAKKVVAAGCRLVDGTEGKSFVFMALRDSRSSSSATTCTTTARPTGMLCRLSEPQTSSRRVG